MIGAALDGIVETVATAVFVVVLGLGYRVVDVDGRYFQRAVLQHLLQTVYASGGLLGDAVDFVQHGRILVMQHAGQVAAVIQHHIGIPGLTVLENSLLQTPVVFFFRLTFPRIDRNARSGDSGRSVILG